MVLYKNKFHDFIDIGYKIYCTRIIFQYLLFSSVKTRTKIIQNFPISIGKRTKSKHLLGKTRELIS